MLELARPSRHSWLPTLSRARVSDYSFACPFDLFSNRQIISYLVTPFTSNGSTVPARKSLDDAAFARVVPRRHLRASTTCHPSSASPWSFATTRKCSVDSLRLVPTWTSWTPSSENRPASIFSLVAAT
jgi:hypothetical protein